MAMAGLCLTAAIAGWTGTGLAASGPQVRVAGGMLEGTVTSDAAATAIERG